MRDFTETEIRNKEIKAKSDRLNERRLLELKEKMASAEMRLNEQQKLLKKKLDIMNMEKKIHAISRQDNIERQYRKNSYRKSQLLKNQEPQRDKRSQEIKNSLMMQSEYLKTANQLRKY